MTNKILYAVALGFFGAVIVHICILFLVPYHGQYNTWLRLQNKIPLFGFHQLAADDPIARTTDPLFKLRACIFTLADAPETDAPSSDKPAAFNGNEPVHISARGKVPFWSMSVYDSAGTKLYSLNSLSTADKGLDIIIGTPLQIMDLKQITADSANNSILVPQAIDNGMVLLRVFAPSKDWQPKIDAFLQNAQCSPVILEDAL